MEAPAPPSPDAGTALGYAYGGFLAGNLGGPSDSNRLYLVLGNRLATIDVAAVASEEAARTAALELAGGQAACLTAGAPCAPHPLPKVLRAPTDDAGS